MRTARLHSRRPFAVVALLVTAGVVLALLPLWPARASLTPAILPLGDSITWGVGSNFVNTPGGYRGELGRELGQAGIPFRYVGTSTDNPPLGADPNSYRHDGHPGFRIDEVESDLSGPDRRPGTNGGRWMTGLPGRAPLQPDVVVVHIGTNDILQAFDPQRRFAGGYDGANGAERAAFVGDMVERLHRLLGMLWRTAPRARIVLCTIAPLGITGEDPTVAAYDAAIRRLVALGAAQNQALYLADVERAFMEGQPTGDAGLMGSDGIHPTSAGYVVMAAAIAPAVEKAVTSPAQP